MARGKWSLPPDVLEAVAVLRGSGALDAAVETLEARHGDASERWQASERGEQVGEWIEAWRAVVDALDATEDDPPPP